MTRVGLRTPRGLATAVERNRIKRQLRAILRGPTLQLRPGADVVIVIRPTQRRADTPALERDMARLLKKLGALRP